MNTHDLVPGWQMKGTAAPLPDEVLKASERYQEQIDAFLRERQQRMDDLRFLAGRQWGVPDPPERWTRRLRRALGLLRRS